ncbi:MAG: DUF3566 domain-containing protein [Corynebacterium sp.]|nr:DUF3566 domain-containing protein [Corynebacterium sp.]
MSARKISITHISPRSFFRTALALSLVGLAAWIICVILLYIGLDVAGVWTQLNDVIGGVGGDATITFGTVLLAASLLGVLVALLNVILAPLIAVVYNSLVDLSEGVHLDVSNEVHR